MKSFKNYLKESEIAAENPVVGDFIDFVINEELIIESSIIDVVDDGIIIELTNSELNLLESVEPMTYQVNNINEDSHDAVRNAITRRIRSQHLDLVTKYGIDRVMDAIDDAADYYGNLALDEIGTSDVSAFVNSVRQSLEGSNRIDELSSGRVERYAHAAQRDMARHSAAAKTLRHQRGAEDWQAQEHEREVDRRSRGLARAQKKMTEGAVKDIAIQYQDWKQMSPREFLAAYKMTKDAWMAQNRDIVKTTEAYELDEMRRRAGVAEGSEILKVGTSVRVPHKGKIVPGKIVRYDSGKGGYSPAYVVDIGEYESKIVPVDSVKQGVAEGDITQLEKDIADAPVRPIASMEASCGSMREVLDRLDGRHQQDEEGGIGAGDLREGRMKQQMHTDAERMDLEAFCDKYGDESWVKEFWHNINDLDENEDLEGNAYEMGYRAAAMYHKSRSSNPFEGVDELKAMEWEDGWHEGAAEEGLHEAEYQGREVKLGKPMSGDTRKYKVYVKDPKTGNVKKVNFGDPNMQIRRDNPKARKSFRARHGCGTPRASDRTKAAYWSCRMWSSKPVSKILKGK